MKKLIFKLNYGNYRRVIIYQKGREVCGYWVGIEFYHNNNLYMSRADKGIGKYYGKYDYNNITHRQILNTWKKYTWEHK